MRKTSDIITKDAARKCENLRKNTKKEIDKILTSHQPYGIAAFLPRLLKTYKGV